MSEIFAALKQIDKKRAAASLLVAGSLSLTVGQERQESKPTPPATRTTETQTYTPPKLPLSGWGQECKDDLRGMTAHVYLGPGKVSVAACQPHGDGTNRWYNDGTVYQTK